MGETTVCRIFSCPTLFEAGRKPQTKGRKPQTRLSGTTDDARYARLESRDPHRRTPGSKFAGGHRIRVPPVPIPNTEVKPDTADGTARETVWESRSLPALFLRPSVINRSGLSHVRGSIRRTQFPVLHGLPRRRPGRDRDPRCFLAHTTEGLRYSLHRWPIAAAMRGRYLR